MSFGVYVLGNATFTTPTQHGHNTPAHGGGANTLGPTPCEGMLCPCCGGVVQQSIPLSSHLLATLNSHMFTPLTLSRRQTQPAKERIRSNVKWSNPTNLCFDCIPFPLFLGFLPSTLKDRERGLREREVQWTDHHLRHAESNAWAGGSRLDTSGACGSLGRYKFRLPIKVENCLGRWISSDFRLDLGFYCDWILGLVVMKCVDF